MRKCESLDIVRNPVISSAFGTLAGSEGEHFFRLLSERPRVRIAVDAPKKEEVLSPSGESALLFFRKARQAALCGIISVRLCVSHRKALPAAHSESQQSIPPISD